MGTRSPRQNGHLQTILIGLVLALSIAMPRNAAAQTITLFGNHPREAAMMTSPPPAALQLNIRVNFALRDRPGLDKLLSELQTPGSPLYHHWLSQPNSTRVSAERRRKSRRSANGSPIEAFESLSRADAR